MDGTDLQAEPEAQFLTNALLLLHVVSPLCLRCGQVLQ